MNQAEIDRQTRALALDQARSTPGVSSPEDVLQAARDFYAFLTETKPKTQDT